MGIIDTLLRRNAGFAPLDPASEAASRIAAVSGLLEALIRKVHVRLELVPAAGTVYVYIDKPPGVFGLAWFEDGREVNFTTLKQEHGLSQGRIQILSKKLGAAYKRGAALPRYLTTIAGREVLVTPSESLAAEIGKAIEEAVS